MEKKRTYFMAVYEAKEGGFYSKVPDFGLVDQGETLEEVVENTSNLLNATIEMAVEDSEPIPEATQTSKELKNKLDKADGEVAFLVPITVYLPTKTERINITAKGNVLALINAYAKKKKVNRSKLMVNATLRFIEENA